MQSKLTFLQCQVVEEEVPMSLAELCQRLRAPSTSWCCSWSSTA
jgi:hypothetical protein